jgi:P27 family predicted phage terminase small subunit
MIQAQRILAKEGLTYMGATGPKRHPACGILSEAQTALHQVAAELSLTPVSRSRLAMRDDDTEDMSFLN